jgi:uncharacterized protein YjhX (UPF0386 family)
MNAICGANVVTVSCYTQHVTSMADTDIDAVKKQKKAEYGKQYRLKRKLLMQEHASTSSETKLPEKQKKVDYDKQ